MTTEQLTGEISRKSIRNRLYTLTASDRKLSFQVNFDQLLARQCFIIGDIVDFEADLTLVEPIFIAIVKKRTNKFFEELKRAFNSRQIIKAFVVEKIAGGFNVRYKGYRCFLPSSEIIFNGNPYDSAEEILQIELDFHVKAIVEKKVILTRITVEKHELLRNKLKEMQTLSPGFSYFATINLITDLGLFLTRHYTSGLLNMNDILGIDKNAANKLKPEFYKLAKAAFEIGDQLFVSVKEIDGEKYSLTWDITSIFNRPYGEKLVSLIAKNRDFIKIKEQFETTGKNYR